MVSQLQGAAGMLALGRLVVLLLAEGHRSMTVANRSMGKEQQA